MSFSLKEDDSISNFQLSDALIGIGPIITVFDINGVVLYVNHVAPGVDITKFIGSVMYNWVPEKTAKIIREKIKEIIETKEEIRYETDFIDPTGLEHSYANHMTPLIRDNEVYGVTIVTHEITELKDIKTQLTRSQDITTLSFESLEIGVWEWDIKNRTVQMDDVAYKIYGWERADFDKSIDTFLTEIFHPEDVKELMLQNRFGPDSEFGTGPKFSPENKLVQGGEIRFIRGYDKEVRWIRYKAKSFYNEEDELIRTLGIGWDVTEEIQKEEAKQRSIELENQNNELKEFAYLASHDLKAPLRTLRSYSDLLTKRYKDKLDDKANMYLQFISEAALEMDNQIKELLNYSLVGQHKDMEMVDCNKLVVKILEKLSFMINTKGSNIEVENLPTISAHSMDISLLFQNLISNAVKFHNKERQSLINISAKQVGDSWQFEVKDNGIGIEDKYLKKIFSIFERLHTKEEFEGTGIGLAHCRKIVELHGGEIWAKSEIGKGSSFFFTIKKTTNAEKNKN